jgi:hypothetical protein
MPGLVTTLYVIWTSTGVKRSLRGWGLEAAVLYGVYTGYESD